MRSNRFVGVLEGSDAKLRQERVILEKGLCFVKMLRNLGNLEAMIAIYQDAALR